MIFCKLLEHFFYEKNGGIRIHFGSISVAYVESHSKQIEILMKTNLEEFYFTEMKTEASTSFTNKEIMFICDDIKYS